MDGIDEAYDRMLAGDVKFRFMIDLESMPALRELREAVDAVVRACNAAGAA